VKEHLIFKKLAGQRFRTLLILRPKGQSLAGQSFQDLDALTLGLSRGKSGHN